MVNKIKGRIKVTCAIRSEMKPKGIFKIFKITKKPTPKIKSGKIIKKEGMIKKTLSVFSAEFTIKRVQDTTLIIVAMKEELMARMSEFRRDSSKISSRKRAENQRQEK